MNLSPLYNSAAKTLKHHAPQILTALGVGGVVTTAYLAGKAAWDAHEDVLKVQFYEEDGTMRNPVYIMPTKERAKLTWKRYLPAAASGAVTIACVLASHKSSANRTAAAVAAYSLTEKAFTEYKDAAKAEIGKVKEQRMRDDMAQETVKNHPPSTREVHVVGGGDVLCLDHRSMRYFMSTHEKLKKAENEINFMLNHQHYVPLEEFYILLGLPITKESVYNGWDITRKLMELEISTTISEDDKPCFVVDFNYCQPIHDPPPSIDDVPPCDW